MTQAYPFLDQPTIEEAYEEHLTGWRSSSIRKSWNYKKPTLLQFTKRFGKSHQARQRQLELAEGGVSVTTVQNGSRQEHIQEMIENIHEALAVLKSPHPADFGYVPPEHRAET